MSKSKIITDLANSNVDLNTSLKRARVLLSNFNEERISSWVKNELEGYSTKESLPQYRIGNGMIRATFFVGYTQYTNVRVPVSDEYRKILEEYCIFQSISSLKEILKEANSSLNVPIPPECYSVLKEQSNIDSIITASVKVDKTMLLDIFSKVESKLLDIFLLLEKEFGNLDELDIDVTIKDKKEIDKIKDQMNIYIFNDNSVKIGNGNKIKGNMLNNCRIKE